MRAPEQPEGALGSGSHPLEPRPGRRPRLVTIIALVIVALAAAGGGIGGLVWAHVRKPTQAQAAAAGNTAFGFQWRWLRAGQIFPATVSYTATEGNTISASLVGIAPQAPCATAVDPGLGRVLARYRCGAMLRATYVDVSRTLLMTVGIAVLPSAAAATAATGLDDRDPRGGLLPLGFPRTVASQFTKSARETWGETDPGGPYILYFALGYADGRKTGMEPESVNGEAGETAPADLQDGIVAAVLAEFRPAADPCAVREVRC